MPTFLRSFFLLSLPRTHKHVTQGPGVGVVRKYLVYVNQTMQDTIRYGYDRATHSTGYTATNVKKESLEMIIKKIRIHHARWGPHLTSNGVTIPDWVME